MNDKERELHSIEKQTGPLPDEYRSFLLQYDGSIPKPNGFRIPDGSTSCVHVFYSLIDTPHWSLQYAIKTFSGEIPCHLLPIGRDPGGNQICIAISGDRRGRIYFWDHETDKTLEIAEQLGVFISKLCDTRVVKDVHDEMSIAIDNLDYEYLNSFIERNGTNYVNELGLTLLDLASLKKDPAATDFLLNKGMEPTVGALSNAARNGLLMTLTTLIAEGGRINDADEFGYTPILYAIESGEIECIMALHSAGAVIPKHFNQKPVEHLIGGYQTKETKKLVSELLARN